MLRTGVVLGVALSGCQSPAAPTVQAFPVDAGLEVRASAPVRRVTWFDGDRPVVSHLPAAPTPVVLLPGRWLPGTEARVRVQLDDGRILETTTAFPGGDGPAAVSAAIPAGSPAVGLERGAIVDVPTLGGGEAAIALVARARTAGPLTVSVGQARVHDTVEAGTRVRLDAIVDAPVEARVEGPGGTWSATLRPAVLPRETIAEALTVGNLAFPADREGLPDPAQASDRLVLPASWWSRALRAAPGLGFRPRDVEIPRAWQGVELHNSGDAHLDVVVRLRIVDEDGAPVPAFRPRARRVSAPDGAITAMVRVPAGGRATAALPVWIDEEALPDSGGGWSRIIDIAAVGDRAPLHSVRAPLVVRRAGSLVTGTAGLAVLAALVGVTGLLGPGLAALRRAATRDLVIVAVFSSLLFVVGAAGQVLGLGAAVVLGPFGPFVTGLLDDALQYALLATLLTLVPRPGTAALAVVLGWLLRGLTLGGFSVVDVVFVGGQVFWLEAWLAGTGISTTRGRWRDSGRVVRWLRLATAFVGASLCTAAAGLALQVVLYRLWLDPTYVAALLAGPSALYVALACALAVPFAESLRRVA